MHDGRFPFSDKESSVSPERTRNRKATIGIAADTRTITRAKKSRILFVTVIADHRPHRGSIAMSVYNRWFGDQAVFFQ
jgi:hypothetical protein